MLKTAMRLGLAVMVLGLMAVGQARAGLTGDTIHGEYFFPDTTNLYVDSGNATVTPVANFTFFGQVAAAVSDNQISITFLTDSFFNPADFNGTVFTDLTNSSITNVTVDPATTIAGFDASRISFTSNTISLNFQSLPFTTRGTIVVDINAAPTTAVPEPATIASLGLGLIVGAGAFIRRKRPA